MNVYAVYAESGVYSDYVSYCEGIYSSFDDAERYVLSQTIVLAEDMDSGVRRWALDDYWDDEIGWGLSDNEIFVFAHPKKQGDTGFSTGQWYYYDVCDPDVTGYHIEKYEVL